MAIPIQSITSINSVLAIQIPGVYDSPVQISRFSVDDMFDLDPAAHVEHRMGVDGHLSGGFVYKERTMKVKLEADSPSRQIFDDWYSGMATIGNVIFAQATITMADNGSVYTLTNGLLTSYMDMPAAKRTLQPVEYTIVWESVIKSNL
jgi:hypothetical protein